MENIPIKLEKPARIMDCFKLIVKYQKRMAYFVNIETHFNQPADKTIAAGDE